MELLSAQQPFVQFQEEKYQMLELNQRLESYLGRVKLLEEENKLLREEIHTLKKNRNPPGQRKAQEEALSQARRMKDEAWRKKDSVELEVENLMNEIEMVSIQRQKMKTAQAEAQRKFEENRKEMEEERRAQIWLREKVAQLENDLLLQMQIHQENMASLQDSLKQTKQVLKAPQHMQTTSIPDLGQEYSLRAAQAWKVATNNYQRQVGRLEEGLNEAKANMAKIHQEKREHQHQVQHLAKELESTKTKRQMLERHAMQQREEHKEELQHLQAQVDTLELQKDSLGQQMDSLMMDRQNLLQVKMSLGLEVATYRALLENEGLRIDRPTTNMANSAFFMDVLSKPTGTRQTTQSTAASCHLSRTVTTSHRSIPSSHALLSSATPTRGAPLRAPTRTSVIENTGLHMSEDIEKAAEVSVKHLHQEKILEGMAIASPLPKLEIEPVPQQKSEHIEVEEEVKQKAHVVESVIDESTVSVSADQLSSLSQTPEMDSWACSLMDPAGVSEEGKDEDTEVSVEMARISYAPKVAWEESKTVAEDERDDASEMDVRSENISESHTVEYRVAENDNNDTSTFSLISQNTKVQASTFLEQGNLNSVSVCKEETNDDLTVVHEQDNVSNISEDVTKPLNSETETAIDEWDRQEEIEPENETNVVSAESVVEDEGEMNNDRDEGGKPEDEKMAEEEEDEIEVIERDISLQDEVVDYPKYIDHQESLQKTEVLTEANSNETVNASHPLPEESDGEENRGDEDDSPNISASCRTDPGECDSYSQENTLADPRPLIHYKSDEETEGSMQVSHLIGETSDSEDEKDRIDGDHWKESTSKRFNTMEDLREEPEMDVIGDMMTEDVVLNEKEQDDDIACMMLQGVSGVHEGLNVENKEGVGIELLGNLEENSDGHLREMKSDEDQDMKVYEQNETELAGKQHIHVEQPENESQEHTDTDHPLSFHETSQLDISFDSLSISDAATTKESEDLLEVSMHTNMDFMDSHSLESEINSQPDIMTSDMHNSEQEECNSSEDDSPNASQCFQNTSLLATAALNEQPLTFTNGVSKTDYASDNIDVAEKSTEDVKAASIDDRENSNIWGKSMSVPDAAELTHEGRDENPDLFPETGNLESPSKKHSVDENIFGKFEEQFERRVGSFSEEVLTVMDFESRDLGEEGEFQLKEKKSEMHSLFSTSLNEDFWSEGKVEMAATYDPATTEDQSVVFGKDWRDTETMSAANGNHKEQMDILESQDEKHEDKKPVFGEMVQSDGSVDEGDSWSSGDE